MSSAQFGSVSLYPSLHRAIADVVGTGVDRKLLLVGDSTTYGYEGLIGLGPAGMLTKLLIAAGIPAALGLVIPPGDLGAAVNDTRWGVGTGWSNPGGAQGWGSAATVWAAGGSTAADSLTFTPSGGYSYDTFDIYFVGNTLTGNVSVNVDGGTATVIDTTLGTNGLGKTTITCPAATNHVVNFGLTTTYTYILGVEGYLSTTPKLRVANAGVDSTATGNWNGTAGNWSGLNCIEQYAPDVTIIDLGINDADTSVTLATYLTNLLAIVTAAKLSGDVIIASPNPINPTETGNPGLLTSYVSALAGFCSTNDCGFLDLYNRWGGQNAWNVLDPLGWYYDNLHPSAAIGYPDIARAELAALVSL